MSNADVSRAITESQNLSVVNPNEVESVGPRLFTVGWMAHAGEIAPPWWSTARDTWLRKFWKSSDHLSGAIYTLQSKMTAIPVRVAPKDQSNKNAVRMATVWTELVNDAPGFGNGWVVEYGKWVEDLTTQDNGAFFEVIGAGPKDGPIEGPAVSICHLDSARCMRTGNPTYPVIYTDRIGRRYKLHFSRVIYSSQMTSPAEEMFGVGFCGISRAIGVSQNLIDIVVYKQEKLGSRPLREIIITRGGLDPQDMADAFTLAESQMDEMGLKRYSKVVVVGNRTVPEGEAQRLQLADLPDGFSEQESVTLAMATIALALGMDARELFPALTSGATRADALLQHLKQRGKGPGQILQSTERQMNFKVVPYSLRFTSDFQDDAQDRQTAEIAMVRANRRVQDKATASATDRVIRERMVIDGDITQEQFDQMELQDGRLSDGTMSVYLVFTKDPEVKKYLRFPGVDNPLDTIQNDPTLMLGMIYENMSKIATSLVNPVSKTEKEAALQAQSALAELETMYLQNPFSQDGMSVEEANNPGNEGGNNSGGLPGRPPKPGQKRVFGKAYVDPRVRRIDTTVPKLADESQNLGESGDTGE